MTQFSTNRTGPGTFVRYLKRAAEEEKLNIFFIADEKPSNDFSGKVYVFSWHEKLRKTVRGSWFFALWAYALQASRVSYPDAESTWIIDPVFGYFFLKFKKFRNKSVLMINDVNNIDWRRRWRDGEISFVKALSFGICSRLERSAVKKADLVVANSEYTKEKIINRYLLDEAGVEVLYKAVDLSMFDLPHASVSDDRFVILFVKADWRRGGLIELIRAAESWGRKSEIWFVGGDRNSVSEIDKIVRLSRLRNVVLKFLGHKPHEAMPELYSRANVVALLSTSEALGVSLIEALAARVPAIGASVGGIPEVLANGSAGFLIDRSDQNAIVGALEKIFTSDPIVASQVEYGRSHAAKFSSGAMFQRIIDISVSFSE